jgi:mannose-6-phosphate isomerase-like protein (cupin superfamily)
MTRNRDAGDHRRVVTGNAAGKSVIKSDEQLIPYRFKSVPGYEHNLVWLNDGIPDLSRETELASHPKSVVPRPGGTSLHIVTFPPDSVTTAPSFDGKAAQQESLARLPGLAETFEHDGGGMHATATVDYSIVFDGEIWLELDDGKTVHLKRGDVVVQNGTRHAWRNKGSESAVMLFFMNGATK